MQMHFLIINLFLIEMMGFVDIAGMWVYATNYHVPCSKWIFVCLVNNIHG